MGTFEHQKNLNIYICFFKEELLLNKIDSDIKYNDSLASEAMLKILIEISENKRKDSLNKQTVYEMGKNTPKKEQTKSKCLNKKYIIQNFILLL